MLSVGEMVSQSQHLPDIGSSNFLTVNKHPAVIPTSFGGRQRSRPNSRVSAYFSTEIVSGPGSSRFGEGQREILWQFGWRFSVFGKAGVPLSPKMGPTPGSLDWGVLGVLAAACHGM